MNLVLDIGNTRVKAAVFDQHQLKHFYVFEHREAFSVSEINPLLQLIQQHSVQACIIASVVNSDLQLESLLSSKVPTLRFTSDILTPLKNLYKTASTLGSDRFASAVGATVLYPDKTILVIDAGTCIKYNLVTRDGEYIGGAISPGLNMRFKALHTFTAKLPEIALQNDFNTLVGTTTEESILSGVELGCIAEVNGIIDQYKQLYANIIIIVTGGDVNFFEKKLKKPIFTDPFLIVKGLNAILEFNLKANKVL